MKFHRLIIFFAVIMLALPCMGGTAGDSLPHARPGTVMVVDKTIDLGGKVWQIPGRVTVQFKPGGSISNGTVKGSATVLDVEDNLSGLFRNVGCG